MKTPIVCLLVLLFTHSAWPCINRLETRYDGSPAGRSSHSKFGELKLSLLTETEVDGAQMERELRGSGEFTKRNDYAVALMYLGRAQEAVERLQQLEQEKPGNYAVAANLGTAFELSGHNREALRWIEEGIRRNSASHEGTEWLHVKILEAKIAAQSDASYFQKHSVLGLKAGEIGQKIRMGGQELLPQDLMKAIQHQLTERLKFVKPPDPAVASLLFDYAAIEAAVGTLEGAKLLLRLAVEYGYPPAPVKVLQADYDRRISWGRIRGYLPSGTGVLIVMIIQIILFLIYARRRGWLAKFRFH